MTNRQFWVVVHRWAGLTMALFLIVAGITGIVLPWQEELIRASRPSLSAAMPPYPGAQPLDGITLGRHVERQTGGTITFLPLTIAPDHVASLFVSAREGQPPLGYDNVWVDPYSGAIRLRTTYAALGDGVHNIVPFLYRLHYSLALGSWGLLVFGMAALVWTIDSLIGFYLTLPIVRPRSATPGARALAATPRTGWWARWRPSWTIRRRARGYKLNFDLHRAGGLWLWPLLFVFAWSSVGFNLPTVYGPVMAALGASPQFAPPPLARPLIVPPIDLRAARRIGHALVADMGRREGFTVERDGYLFYQAATGFYAFSARTSADPSNDDAGTRVWFDARSGRLAHIQGPGRETAADATTRWFAMLHTAQVFGLPYRVFVSCFGAMVVVFSVTGIAIWMKKRTARLLGRHRTVRPARAGTMHGLPAE